MKVAVTMLAFCVTSLLALGLVMLYSSSMTQVGAHYLMMQLIWCVFGFGLCVAAASLDYQLLKKFAWPIFILAFFLLVLVLVPHIGRKINGARRWFDLHGVRFQPSELGKIALIIALAWYGDRFQRRMHTFKWGIVFPVCVIAAILGLVFVEPDRGTTILLAAVSGSILLLAGVQWKFIIPPVILAVAGLVVSILHDPMRMKRIFSWLDLEQNKDGVGYQAYQAMIALGSGGWTGLGLGNGRQKLGFVPEHHTDFIFSIIGEELGLVATLLVIVAFVVIALCGLYIALHARDTFGTLLATGITLLISLQAAINIGVVTSALPNKGLPLPFISYGGSNLLAMLTCVGILFSIARQAAPSKISASDFVSNDNPFAAKAT
ncbi:MAG TPA: putative lipid II flippase FtsW [Verrucomicrobiae bacterium]